MKIKKLLRVKILQEYITVFKEDGFKVFLSKGEYIVYLIRDSILYILIAYIVVKGFFL